MGYKYISEGLAHAWQANSRSYEKWLPFIWDLELLEPICFHHKKKQDLPTVRTLIELASRKELSAQYPSEAKQRYRDDLELKALDMLWDQYG